jgi:hypothetical protein
MMCSSEACWRIARNARLAALSNCSAEKGVIVDRVLAIRSCFVVFDVASPSLLTSGCKRQLLKRSHASHWWVLARSDELFMSERASHEGVDRE